MESKEISLTAKDILVGHSKIKNPKRLEQIYEGYKKKNYFVNSHYNTIYLTDKELWTSKGNDRTWLFYHHSLVSVSFLIDSYYIDKNKDKLNLAYEIVEKWFECNYPSSASVMGWHDHSTALRLLHLIKLYLLFKQKGDSNYERRLSFICEEHMKKLTDKDFYMVNHNHGIDQDMSLYIAASVIDHSLDSEKLRSLAIERFWKQMDNLFSDDGCYLEHSPQYIYILLDHLLGFCNILFKLDIDLGRRLQERINKIVSFYIYILQPNAKFPTIGDSEHLGFDITEEYWKHVSKDLFQILRNIKGYDKKLINLPTDKFYSDGQYALFRNNWKNDSSTIQIIFYSAFHSRVHKHHDDLSFILYAYDMPLFIDGGKFNYQYDQPERKYIVSAYGHNSVRINNTETDLSRLNINKSGILSFLTTNNLSYASGFHALSKGTTHRRILLYLKPYEIIILDLIKGHINTNTELIFNLNTNLVSEIKDNKVTSYYKGSALFNMKSLLKEKGFDKKRGLTDPLKGWSSLNYNKFEENDIITQKKKGSIIKYATHIGLNLEDSVSEFVWAENKINFKWKNFNVLIYLTDFYEHIFINNKLYNPIRTFNNKKLIEAITRNESSYFKTLSDEIFKKHNTNLKG